MDPADRHAILEVAKSMSAGDDDEEDDDLEAAPLHLHTLREPALLKGRPSSRASSRSRTSSRDPSPSPMGHRRKSSSGLGTPAESIPGSLAAPISTTTVSSVAATHTTASSVSGSAASDAGSDIDPDILLDRLGFDSDLEQPAPHEIGRGDLALGSTWGHSSSTQPLPSLNERMTEDSLEDAGAFADLVSTLHSSLRAHALSGEIEALGILDEVGEEADDEWGSSEEEGEEGDTKDKEKEVQVLDDLLAKVSDPAERAKLLKLKRDHSDKIQAVVRGIADKERRASLAEEDGDGDDDGADK
jgi:hypothetical protein